MRYSIEDRLDSIAQEIQPTAFGLREDSQRENRPVREHIEESLLHLLHLVRVVQDIQTNIKQEKELLDKDLSELEHRVTQLED